MSDTIDTLYFKDKLFHFMHNGVVDKSDTEAIRRIYLINMFTFVGLFFTLPLGINAFCNAMFPLAIALLLISFVLIITFILLKITKNYKHASYAISALFFFLMAYLVYTGGVDHTGPLWIYSLPMIIMFLLGFKRGLTIMFLFLIVLTTILFGLDSQHIAVEYSYSFKVRIILSFIAIMFLASVYEFIREKTYHDMLNLKKILENTSKQDPLTGLYNRRAYKENIQSLHNSQGTILMCDIDHFKKINDYFGHYIGDMVLIQVAKCIQENIRSEDLAIRWGGEEFLIFLPDSSLDNGYIVSEKLRKSIENLSIRNSDGILIKVTISIGVSLVNHTTPLSTALRHADKAMYIAKNSGRNKTSVYSKDIFHKEFIS